jgi:hypothetical protein
MLTAAGAFSVAPNLGLVVWTVLVWSLLTAAAITAAKARWEWLLIGLFTGGLLWLISAFLPARPHSLWRRLLDRTATRGASAS